MHSAEIMGEVIELIGDPNRWCQGTVAKDSGGRSVLPGSADACKWCLSGAICKVADTKDVAVFHFVTEAALGELIPVFNDNNNHATVIDKLKAIKESWTK